MEVQRDRSGRFEKGNFGFWLGKKRSEDTNKKIRETLTGRFSGSKHPSWEGGRYTSAIGYIFVYSPGHPRAISRKYVAEHILIMEKHLGRYLVSGEVVHHLNGKKSDNRIRNLTLLSASEHTSHHMRDRHKKLGNCPIPNSKICETCKRSFKPQNGRRRFCSMRCHGKARSIAAGTSVRPGVLR